MATINPYINFNGNTEEAFNFYKAVFGGEFASFQRFGDMPAEAGCGEMSESVKNRVMHVALPIGGGNTLMGTDMVEGRGEALREGNNFSLSIGADSKEEAEQLFNGLAAGGTTVMPLGDTFWGAYFGMLKDKYGIQWMVNYDYPRH